ncbi:movement protein [Mexico trichovirus]|uniref:Movement protein n=1 Tax=peach virus M TaxID=3070926 RepID=A0AA48YTU9_9VIRU|nr:movement protein [Mexico trichovirus]QDR50349.1 movement protein [peach virus M]
MTKMALMMRAHKSKIAEGDIPISGVKSSRIYSDVSVFKRASDLMIHWNEFAFKIMPEDIGEDGFRLMSIPVAPEEEIEAIKKNRGSANYLHWGALSISIDALFKKKAGVTGRCIVFDKRWETFDQAVLQTFEFSLDSGSATMITAPNFSVALDDPGLNSSLCVVVVFNDLNFKMESYPVSVRVGNMCRFFDSFLGAEVFKNESNVYLDSSGADLLSYKSFGFEKDDEVERLFGYAEAVPTKAIEVNVRKIPGSIRNMFKAKEVRQFTFGSKSDPRARRRSARVKSLALRGEYSGSSVQAGEIGEQQGDLELSEEKNRDSRNAFGNNQNNKDVCPFEFSEQNSDRIDCMARTGESPITQQVSSGNKSDTEIHLRKHSHPRDVGFNGVYLNPSSGSKSEWSGSVSDVQSEDSCWVDKTFRINKRG